MHSSALRAASVVALVLLAGTAVAGSLSLRGPRYEKRGTLHCIAEGSHVYSFDAAWRVETLRALDPATGIGCGRP